MLKAVILVLLLVIGSMLTFLILIQESNGNMAGFGGTKAALANGVTNPVRRATVWLSIVFFVLATVSALLR